MTQPLRLLHHALLREAAWRARPGPRALRSRPPERAPQSARRSCRRRWKRGEGKRQRSDALPPRHSHRGTMTSACKKAQSPGRAAPARTKVELWIHMQERRGCSGALACKHSSPPGPLPRPPQMQNMHHARWLQGLREVTRRPGYDKARPPDDSLSVKDTGRSCRLAGASAASAAAAASAPAPQRERCSAEGLACKRSKSKRAACAS